jgi:hypothetical protein
MLGILGEVAQHEIAVKSDRQRRASRQAAEQGKPPAGPRPFGFKADRMTLEPAEADAIRRAYRVVLGGGSLAGIAREWNDAGLRSSRHGPSEPPRWSAETVKALLVKPRSAGIREYQGAEYPAQWPAIVPEETYRAALALLTDPSRRQSTAVGRYLLSGVGLCGVCRATVQAGPRTTYHAYRCSSLGHVSRRGDAIDQLVGDVVIARLSRPDARDLLHDHSRPDVEQLRDRAQSQRARLDELATEFADGALTASQLRTATERIRSNLAVTEHELADAGRVDVLGDLVNAEDVAAAWGATPTDRQRGVIDALMTVTLLPVGRGRRYFDPETVEIEWKAG